MARNVSVVLLVAACFLAATPSRVAAQRSGRSRLLVAEPEAVRRAASPGAPLRLRLFADADLLAVAERIERGPAGELLWSGRLEDDPGSRVLLAESNGVLAGLVLRGAEVYQVRYAGGGLHRIRELGPEVLGPWGDDGVVSPDLEPGSSAPPSLGLQRRPPAEPTTFDLLALYTPAAAGANGGRRGMRALVRLQVALANEILEASRAHVRIRLVGVRRVGYQESDSLAMDLSRLKETSDPHLRAAHSLRDRFGADFVTLYVHQPRERFCGRAYLAWGPRFFDWGVDPATAAFSILRPDCPDWVLVHELGHNMGLHHAREDQPDPHFADGHGAYPFSYGYKNPAHRFFTVMANPCAGCRRLLQFSNPRLRHEGKRTGVKHTRELSADCARSINLSRQGLAEHRPCRRECGGQQ